MGTVTIKVPRLRFIAGRYFWRPTPEVRKLGFVNEALGSDLAKAVARAKELNEEVEKERTRAPGSGSAVPGTVAHLVKLYRADPRFLRLAPKTQQGYGSILDEIERVAGKIAVKGIGRRDLVQTYRALQPRGLAIAAAHMRMWRILLGYAWDEGMRGDNPARGLRLVTPDARSRVWTPAEADAFCAAAVAAGRPSLALAVRMALAIGQRQGDVLALSWDAFDGKGVALRQRKTGTRIVVPLPRELAAELAGMERKAGRILVSETSGEPWGEDHFRHEFARIRAAAGLPRDLQFRDLRRTAATEIGASGGTDDEIRAVTGHLSRGVVAVYVRPDDRMAAAAIRKREAAKRKNVAKPPAACGKTGADSGI